MLSTVKILAAASALALSFAGGASALTLDFTDHAAYAERTARSASGTIGNGVSWTLSPNRGSLTYSPFDGDRSNTALAFDNDGVGIGDDEVTAERRESLLLTFSRQVRLTGVHALDLFFEISRDGEQALAFDADTGAQIASLTAGERLSETRGGYVYASADALVRSIRFEAGGVADDRTRDFALAAVEVQPVPVPAAGLLLLAGLGGLGLARRRRTA